MAASRGGIILQSLSNKVKQETRKVSPSSSENSILRHNSYGSNGSNSMKQFPTSKITDFALGHLSPEDNLRLLEEIEKSEEFSKELELVVDPVGALEQGNHVHLRRWKSVSRGASSRQGNVRNARAPNEILRPRRMRLWRRTRVGKALCPQRDSNSCSKLEKLVS